MVGSATLTIVASSTIISMPTQSTYSASHRRRSSFPITPILEGADPWLRLLPRWVRCPLGLADDLVGEVGQPVTDGPGVEEAYGFLVARLAEEPLAGPQDDGVDHQPELVDQGVLHQRLHELP